MASNITEVPFFSSKVKLGKNGEHATAATAAFWACQRG